MPRLLLLFVLLVATRMAAQSFVDVGAVGAAYYDETGVGTLTQALEVGLAEPEFGRAFTVIDFTVRKSDLPGATDAIQGLSLRLTKVHADANVGGKVRLWLASNNTRTLGVPAVRFATDFLPDGINSTASGPFGELTLLGTATIVPGNDGLEDRIGAALSPDTSAVILDQIDRVGKVRLVVTPADGFVATAWSSGGLEKPTLSLVSGLAWSAPTPAALPIVGTWVMGNPANADSSTVVTFKADGTYFAATDTTNGGPNAPTRDGIEIGTYFFDPETMTFHVYASTDTDGTAGLGGFYRGGTATVSNGRLNINTSGLSRTFDPVAKPSEPLVGSWYGQNEYGTGVVTFFDNDRYILVQDGVTTAGGSAGMERGTYHHSSLTGRLTTTVEADTNGAWGFSGALPEQTITVAGDILTYTGTGPNNASVAYSLRRVTGSSPESRLINLSMRTDLGGALGLQTVGFVVGGAGSKPIFARNVGPSLAAHQVTNPLADPLLILFQGPTAIATNDNWGGDAALVDIANRVGAFALAGAGTSDSVIFAPQLTQGAHTLQAISADGSLGNALIEIYDATPAAELTLAAPRLINLSALVNVAAGGSATAGFVIRGNGMKTVLLRAVGPGLAPYLVDGRMPNPQLVLNDPVYAFSNDNWGTGGPLSDVFTKVGAFPLDASSADAALLVTLPAGAYTVTASDRTGAAGKVLIEVYEVD